MKIYFLYAVTWLLITFIMVLIVIRYYKKLNYIQLEPSKKGRFLTEGFITHEQCKNIISVMHDMNEEDVGENLSGLTLHQIEKNNPEQFNLVIQVREKILNKVRQTFEDDNIYIEFTHLTKRLPGQNKYSHDIHSDNCSWNFDKMICEEKEDSCCNWRSHSAILYLNECDGGEFFFYEPISQKKTFLKPFPGTLLYFSSGAENLHGVEKLTNGIRYAFAVWFTKDPERQELIYYEKTSL